MSGPGMSLPSNDKRRCPMSSATKGVNEICTFCGAIIISVIAAVSLAVLIWVQFI